MKLKITKRNAIMLAVVVGVLALGVMALLSIQQLTKQNNLRADIASEKQKLAAFHLDSFAATEADLNAKIADTKSQVSTLEATFRPDVASIPVVDTVARMALDNDLSIGSMTSSGMSDGQLNKLPVTAQKIDISVGGSVSSVYDFINALIERYPSGSLTSVQATQGETQSWTATISLIVYSREGK